LTCCPQVDSREQHGELGRLELNAILGGMGHLKSSNFESFVPDGEPVAVKIEQLDAIPATIEKEEEVAA
jgi:hypothetical protein